MASTEKIHAKIHETITRLRRRVHEIDALIAQLEPGHIERGRIPVTAKAGDRPLRPVRLCRRRRRDG
jgi:hypothetical protein